MMDDDGKMPLHDPQPFGPTSVKPRISLLGRALCVLATPMPSSVQGFETVVAIEIETADQVLRFSIDQRSADLLAHAIPDHLKPFQSENLMGTLSSDALNPST